MSPQLQYGSLAELMYPRISNRLQQLLRENQGHVERVLEILVQERESAELADQLRGALISAIRFVNEAGNAELASGLAREQIVARYNWAWTFLAKFQAIFTTNYDLLLYYVQMHAKATGRADGWRDGFTSSAGDGTLVCFSSLGLGREIHYLHGALHLVTAGDGRITCKRKRQRPRDGEPWSYPTSILTQVEVEIQRGNLPLIVTEGLAHDKVRQIRSNAYLAECLSQFGNSRGNLVVVGFSFSTSDGHLLEAMARDSGLLSITASYHGEADRAAISAQLNRLNDMRRQFGLSSLPSYLVEARRLGLWEPTAVSACGMCGADFVEQKGQHVSGHPATCIPCIRELMGVDDWHRR